MTFLLDTNIISELRRRSRADRGLLTWADVTPAAQTFLSAVTVLEIELGALQKARKDKAQGAVLRNWIDQQILPHFYGRILPVDVAVAQACARLHVPTTRSERDALIAATALVHSMTVVTRNSDDFKMDGVRVLNPWQ